MCRFEAVISFSIHTCPPVYLVSLPGRRSLVTWCLIAVCWKALPTQRLRREGVVCFVVGGIAMRGVVRARARDWGLGGGALGRGDLPFEVGAGAQGAVTQ